MLSQQGVVLLRRGWKCGSAGVGVAMLEEVCHWAGGGFGVSKAQVSPFLLPVGLDAELSATSPESCLPMCCHENTVDKPQRTKNHNRLKN